MRERSLLLPLHTFLLISAIGLGCHWRQHYHILYKVRHFLEVCLILIKMAICLLDLQLVFLLISDFLPPLISLTTTIIFLKITNYKEKIFKEIRI